MTANYYDAPGHRMAPRETKREKKARVGLGVSRGPSPVYRAPHIFFRFKKPVRPQPAKTYTMRPGAPVAPKKSFFQKVVSFFKGGRA